MGLLGGWGQVLFRGFAAFTFAACLGLSSHTQPADISSDPLIPCFDPHGPEAIYEELQP